MKGKDFHSDRMENFDLLKRENAILKQENNILRDQMLCKGSQQE